MVVKIKVNRPVKQLNHFLDGLVMIFSFSASKTRRQTVKEKAPLTRFPRTMVGESVPPT
jgi:hypothetical protein